MWHKRFSDQQLEAELDETIVSNISSNLGKVVTEACPYKSKLEQNSDFVWKGNLGWRDAGAPECALHLGTGLSWAVHSQPCWGHLAALTCPELSGCLKSSSDLCLKNTSREMQEGCKTQEDGNSQTTAFIYFFPTKPHKLKLLKSARSH